MILRHVQGDEIAQDSQFFFALKNDPQAVRFSYTKRGIKWAEHQQWWGKTGDHRLIAQVDGKRIGIVRLTPLDETTCEIHFSIVPEERGKDWAASLLKDGRCVAADLGYKHIIARVDAPNTASIRAFLREGYQITSAGTLFLERDV